MIVASLDQRNVVDPFYLSKKDPNYQYRFLRDDKKNLSEKTSNLLFQKGGWQIVPRGHLINKLGISEEFISKDGMYRAGDQILAFMPKKLYLEKEAQKLKRANEPVSAVKRMLDQGDPSMAGVGHANMRGIQTKEQLGMK